MHCILVVVSDTCQAAETERFVRFFIRGAEVAFRLTETPTTISIKTKREILLGNYYKF